MSEQSSEPGYGQPIYHYAAAMQEAARSDDVSRMRELERSGERHLEEVRSALEELRAAIRRHQG